MRKSFRLISSAVILVLSLFYLNNRVFAAAEEEKITIVTYYPTPSGTYNQLTTSGNTYLATGATANVGIGTTAPVGLLQVGTSPSPGLMVTASGNVGIGITDPGGYKLYVNGNAYVGGNIICDGTGNTQRGFNGTISLWGPNGACNLVIEEGVITDYTLACKVPDPG